MGGVGNGIMEEDQRKSWDLNPSVAAILRLFTIWFGSKQRGSLDHPASKNAEKQDVAAVWGS